MSLIESLIGTTCSGTLVFAALAGIKVKGSSYSLVKCVTKMNPQVFATGG